jgi:hypothetical protein
MRLLALSLALAGALLASLSSPSIGRADGSLPPTTTVLSLNSHGADAELGLADLWVARMKETRLRRQRLEHWAVPTLLGAAAVAGAGTALLPGLTTEGRIVAGASAVIAAAAMFPPMFSKPENRARWFAVGGGLFAMAYGASGFVDTLVKRNHDCKGYCYNESWVGWAGSAFFVQGMTLIPMGFLPRGPTVAELSAYHQLPAGERPRAARRILARIDRDERKAQIVQLSINMVGATLFTAGAILMKDGNRSDRAILSGFAGFTIGTETITDIMRLCGKSRLERFSLGEAPNEIERVFW